MTINLKTTSSASPPFQGDLEGRLLFVMTKKEIVKLIVQVIIAALTALGTSLGVVSCI